MIIIYLKGGLGNQMFQYAVGRHLAYIHNTELKMDLTAYHRDAPRQYSLGPFNIRENFASFDEISSLTDTKQNRFQRRLYGLLHKHPKRPQTFIRGNYMHFNSKILQLPDNIYLEGYWHSEKYFIDIAKIIRTEFTIKNPAVVEYRELGELIATRQSVAISVRRGDYVTNLKTNLTHGVCGLNYYHDCIGELASKVKDPHFFVFSDALQWCRDNLQLSYPVTLVAHGGMEQPHEHLHLMSQCKHAIISNSSFSWWGAWLNRNPGKIIMAPKNWFSRKDKNPKNILPASWIKR